MPEHAALFGRAALVARDPDDFDAVAELESTEREALAYERDHKWHGPAMLWYSISLCAVGAATQGWDQTGSNGANLSFPDEFGLTGSARGEWIVGVINAIIFLTAGLMWVLMLAMSFGSKLICATAAHSSSTRLTTTSADAVKSSSPHAV